MSAAKVSNKRGRLALLCSAVLIAGAGVAAWFYFDIGGNKDIDPAALYQTAIAAPSNVSRTIAGEGKVAERESISLYVGSTQKVGHVAVREGDMVEAGDLLISYDIADDLTELERQRSEAALYLSNARLALENIARPVSGNQLLQYQSELVAADSAVIAVKKDIELIEGEIAQQEIRVDNLRQISISYRYDYDDGFIDRQDYDTARANHQIAEAALENLKVQLAAKNETLALRMVQLDDAQRRLNNALDPLSDPSIAAKYEIQQNLVAIYELTLSRVVDDISKLSADTRSPATGLITHVNVSEGGMASAYSPVIELADLSKPVIRFDAGEYDAPQLFTGQKALLTFPGLPDEPFEGSISKIGARAEIKEDSGDSEVIVPVEITLAKGDERLLVGYSVNIEIVLEEKEAVISAPIRAIVSENGENFIYVVQYNTIFKRKASVGLYGDRSAEITGGLYSGDVYITNPLDVNPKHIADYPEP